ncbi:MAG TPA: gamma-glutamyl-gamma-aminobutyrate hydrolase family protein [Terriglobales bacterium]|nr:gamma-glutamyl-gamma-aminobutyrate hydrolase family protein [Terriglobales bacterium]
MRPIIGISSYHRDGDFPLFSVPCSYVDALRTVGATPVVLPPGEPSPGRLLDLLDGLILAGGGDLDPQLYGGAVHPLLYMISNERDRFEMEIAADALDRVDIPMLCICRGMQVLNVAAGGTLHVHVPDRFGENVLHRLPPRLPTRHPVRLEGDSRLAQIVGSGSVEVCSWHHQAVDRLGSGLVPVAWSEDGVVEAVEHRDHPWCIGVQWHPEMQFREAEQMRLFEAFVDAARRRRQASLSKE